jgi:hypothetical protein
VASGPVCGVGLFGFCYFPLLTGRVGFGYVPYHTFVSVFGLVISLLNEKTELLPIAQKKKLTKLNPQQFKAKDRKTTAFLFLANYYRVFYKNCHRFWLTKIHKTLTDLCQPKPVAVEKKSYPVVS